MLDRRFSDEPFANREFIVNEPLRDLNSERCCPRPELEDSEAARDLTNIVFSAKLEVEPSAALKLVARPLISVPALPSEPVRDLNNDVRSAKVAAEPIDVLKFTPRPLKSDDASPTEPDRDLNKEVWSRRLEAELKEPDSDLANPLVSE